MFFERGVISLEVLKNKKMAVPPSAPCTFFCRPRAAWECDFYVFQDLCGARVLYGRLRPLAFSGRIAIDDTSNEIFVVLMFMPLKPKRQAQSVPKRVRAFASANLTQRHAAKRAHMTKPKNIKVKRT